MSIHGNHWSFPKFCAVAGQTRPATRPQSRVPCATVGCCEGSSFTRVGPIHVAPPSVDRTTRYWFSSGVLKFSNATQSAPVVGLTVGVENWFESQLVAVPPVQNGALALMTFGADHEYARSSE